MTQDPAGYFPGEGPSRILTQNLKFEDEFEAAKADGFETKIKKAMHEMGIPPRLQKAARGAVPDEVKNLKFYQNFPANPFGMVGPTGCGKSCALVLRIKEILKEDLEKAGPTRIEEVNPTHRLPHIPFEGTRTVLASPYHQFKWIGWPSFTVHMKSLASRREWNDPRASVFSILEWACREPERRILILDDLGMENAKAEAYTTEQLELLVDEAYNNEVRIFWTSNRSPEDLEKPHVYGPRLVSRLTGASPDAQLPITLPDLRVRGIK